AARARRRAQALPRAARLGLERQRQRKARALAGRRSGDEIAPVSRRDALGDKQTEPHAAFAEAAGVIAIEEVRQLLGRDARPFVEDFNDAAARPPDARLAAPEDVDRGRRRRFLD